MYNNIELLVLIVIIGIATLVIRASFLYKLPDIAKHPLMRRGMDAVPAAMLVALVVPFTLFKDQVLNIARPEVIAIIGSIPIIYFSKKFAYGLLFAISIYILLSFIM